MLDDVAVSIVSAANSVLRDVNLRHVDLRGRVLGIDVRQLLGDRTRRVGLSLLEIDRRLGKLRWSVAGVARLNVREPFSGIVEIAGQNEAPRGVEAPIDDIGRRALPSNAWICQMLRLTRRRGRRRRWRSRAADRRDHEQDSDFPQLSSSIS